MQATLMNEDPGATQETALVHPDAPNETGDLTGMLNQLFGGPSGAAAALSGNGSVGQTLGGLGGAALGTALGGPAGTAIGGALGRMGGQAAETLIGSALKKRSKKKQLSRRERRILADGEAATKRTGDQAFVEEARLRVYKPVEYKKRRDAGQLPTQLSAAARGARISSTPPPELPPEVRQRPRIQFTKQEIEAIRERSRANPWENMQLPAPYKGQEPAIQYAHGAHSRIEPSEAEMRLHQDELREYNDTASPIERPTPRRHLSVVPIPEPILQKIMVDVPALKLVDPRILRLATGGTPGARDVAGVDPTSGQYIAAPGETAQGIAKKLTGQFERTAELLSANPAHRPGLLAWNIPPGWLMYDRDTGAVITKRSYVVQKDDTPYKIAKMMGALSRPKWWAELRAANPHKTVTNGNWTSLYPNEEIGIPDEWPEHPLAKPVNPAAPTPTPGFPGPAQNSTMDVGVVANAQILTAAWARRYGACDPLDFGLQPQDFSGVVDARTQRALMSFQLWWNKWNPARTLRTDGTIDAATQTALKEAVFSQVPGAYGGQSPQPPPTPQPNPPPQPTPQPNPPPSPGQTTQSPLPFPVYYMGKPGVVTVVTPMGPLELPAKPGTIPGTVSITIPGYGQLDNVPVIGAFQPAQQQPSPPPPPPPPPPAPPQPRVLDGSQLPFPVYYGTTPGTVRILTPGGYVDLPASAGTKPGTVAVDVPMLGRVDNIIVMGVPPSEQPKPAPEQPKPAPEQPKPAPASNTIKVDVPGWGPVDVKVEPGSKPGTVIVDAPYIGRREIPIRAGSTPGTVAVDMPPFGTIDNIPLPPGIPPPPSSAQAPAPPPGVQIPAQMPLDAHLSEQDKEMVRNIIATTQDPGHLEMTAQFYEGMGYPLAAAAMKAQAELIRATKMPPLEPYTLDAHLPADARQIVEYSLKNSRDPDNLDYLAQSYAQQGYPLTALALAKRAQVHRAMPYNGPEYPPPGPLPELPKPPPLPPVPPPPPQSTNQGASSGILPMVAVLGAMHLLA